MAANQQATATFTGAEPLDGDQSYVDLTWPTMTTLANVRLTYGVQVDDGSGAVAITLKNHTLTGVRVLASAPFTGKVYVAAAEYA